MSLLDVLWDGKGNSTQAGHGDDGDIHLEKRIGLLEYDTDGWYLGRVTKVRFQERSKCRNRFSGL